MHAWSASAALLVFAIMLGFTGPATLATPSTALAAADWELTALGEPALRILVPSSGVLFAQSETGVFRSDDLGDSWAPVSLGPATTLLAVDPIQDTTLYATGPNGVYKTTDAAANWQQIFVFGPTAGGKALALAVSPADRNLLYLPVAGSPEASEFWFYRSRDGGSTWQQLEHQHFSLCSWDVRILQAHPRDARRVFRAADCIAGRNVGESLQQSSDAGDTWQPIFNPRPSFDRPDLGYPQRLVGGDGAEPRRFYLAANRDRRVGGSTVFRSDDDALTWTEVLAYRGGGTPGFAVPGEDTNAPDVQLGGLAYDPARPDQVYVGRQVFEGFFEPPSGGAVAASRDGGETWADLGRQDIGAVRDLALGADGAFLFAATDLGLWRLSVTTVGK